MRHELKKISDQVIVITGASSGIGLATARRAARKGARLVLASRNGDALVQLSEQLGRLGCQVIHVVADVGQEHEVRNIGKVAIERFGAFDTWVNNAGVAIYGRAEDVSVDDMRRLFDTNFWGVVHGSRVAVDHLKWRGGALINVGSEVSDVALPLQGVYAASKHAVKAFTDVLRMELEEEGAPISVTLVKPGSVDTPLTAHARNYLDAEPRLVAPVYAPEVVAEAILFAAENPKRDVFVGASSKLFSTAYRHAPRVLDRYMERVMFARQMADRPARSPDEHALYQPGPALRERGDHAGHVRKSSVYTAASTHPRATGAFLLGVLLAVAAFWQARRGSRGLPGEAA